MLLYSSAERCQICGKKLTVLNRALDHDHKTRKVRGILCKPCNLALGYLRDNPRIAERAMLYLRSPPPLLVVKSRARLHANVGLGRPATTGRRTRN